MEKQKLLNIDALAIAICTLMDSEKKNEFFEYQEKRRESGEGYKRKYYVGRTYYKGEKIGQERDVYDIDGEGFIKLWESLEPYALKIVGNFYRSRMMFSGEDEDTLFEIKFQTLRILRFFGPTPSNMPFSSMFTLFCKNILTNEVQKRYGTKTVYYEQSEIDAMRAENNKQLKYIVWDEVEKKWCKPGKKAYKTKVNYLTASLFNDVMIEEGEDGNWAIDYLPSVNQTDKDIEFQTCIPYELKDIVNYLVDGHTFNETSEKFDIKAKALKRMVSEFAEDFCN